MADHPQGEAQGPSRHRSDLVGRVVGLLARLALACIVRAMRLSEALSPATWIEVPFAGGGVLKVKYQPSRATLAEMQSLTAGGSESEQVERIVERFLEMVVDWDLTEDDGETKVALEHDRLMNLPANIFRTVLVAVMNHQNAGEAASS